VHHRDVASQTLFSEEECEAILRELEVDHWSAAAVTGNGGYGARTDTTVRSASLQPIAQTSPWAVSKLIDAAASLNAQFHRFHLTEIPQNDGPSVLRYRAEEGGHFLPHTDAGVAQSTRKLTYVVQLSDGNAYTGGDLVIMDGGKSVSRDRGTLTVFPSTLTHVVSPVTTGERFVLVGWIHGPALS
jgi:PKHD-type hydroxylase